MAKKVFKLNFRKILESDKMSKRKPTDTEGAAGKRPRYETSSLKFVSSHDKETTRKYITKVKKKEETEILVDFNKEEFLNSIKTTDKEGHYNALKNDTGCFKHVMTPDGKKTGKTDHINF